MGCRKKKDLKGKTKMTQVNPKVFRRCLEVFGDREIAMRWLESPNLALGTRRPIDLLSAPEGIKQVLDVLTRIEHGVFS